jgi:hypothetical protein
MIVPTEATGQSVDVQVADDSGLGVTGLIAGTFPVVKYSLAGANADVTVSLSNLSALTDPWTSGGLKERGGGFYRLDLPDTAWATAGRVTVRGEASGQHLLCPAFDVGVLNITADVTATGGLRAFYDLNGNVVGTVGGIAAGGIAAVSIAAGAITDTKFSFPAEAAGRPTTFMAVVRRLWEWSCNKRVRTRTAGVGTLVLRNAADGADLETQTESTSGTIDTITKGV